MSKLQIHTQAQLSQRAEISQQQTEQEPAEEVAQPNKPSSNPSGKVRSRCGGCFIEVGI
jgi:hypothetical protein